MIKYQTRRLAIKWDVFCVGKIMESIHMEYELSHFVNIVILAKYGVRVIVLETNGHCAH